jgi:archaellum component FlaC
MTTNKLYRFISRSWKIFPIKQHLDKDNFHFKVDSEQHNYVLYNLAVDNCRIKAVEENQQYTLESHHISFYEMQDNKNPCWSQYHYTAYFNDKDNKKYHLHVYFDQNDQLTTSAILSIEDDKGLYVKQKISSEFTDDLAQLAIDQSFRFISELRAQYQNSLNNLETRYNELEQELGNLSSNLVANRDLYLAKLEITIEILTQLSDYRPQYRDLINLFSRFEKYLQESSEKPDAGNNNDEFIEKSSDIAIVNTHSKKIASVRIKKSIQTFIQQALEYRDAFLTLPVEASYENQLTSFLRFLESTQDAWIATENDDYSVTPEDLQNIQNLISKSTAEAKKLLTRLLLSNNFQLAGDLKNFVDLVADKLIKLALVKGNSELLDFLLNNSDFPINTFPIADNLSPVLFCFLKHSEKASKIGCLSVLIKHNASLMVKTEDGLSVAHHILNTVHHPLRVAFENNEKKTRAHPQFYKALICEIETYLNRSDISETNKNKLICTIEQYKFTFKLLTENNSQINSDQIVRSIQFGEQIGNHYKKSVVEALGEDKDIQQAFLEYKEAFKTLSKKLSKRELSQITKQGNHLSGSVNDIIKITGVDDDISVIKTNALKVLNDSIRATILRSQLKDVQQELTKSLNGSKFNSKRKNFLESRQREILTELKLLREPYQALDNGETTIHFTIKNPVEELETMLKELSALLDPIKQQCNSILPALTKYRTKALNNASNSNFTAEDLELANLPIEDLISSIKEDDSIGSSQSSENTINPIPKI